MKNFKSTLFFLMLSLQFPLSLLAETGDKINKGDTAWMLISTALVVLMTPAGLALFYGGMSRSKNLLNTVALSLVSFILGSIVWIAWGYSLAFSGNYFGFVGNLSNFFLKGISINSVSGTIPTLLFVAFQMTFAGITIALVSGSIVERTKFSWWIVFSILWLTFVYSPVAHWVWGGGWLAKIGALDFAGGTVVHINAGISGLVLAILIGKRKGYGKVAFFPSSVLLTTLGAGLLWFGWFGFNAGSELAADGLAANALLVTNTSAAFAAFTWLLIEWLHTKKPTVLGIASGAVAGLVAITPAAGFVGVFGATMMGIGGGFFGYLGVSVLKNKFKYDDSLDAFGVHGVVGIWGAIATGIFATTSVNSPSGLLEGNLHQFLVQILAVVVTIIYSAVMTVILAYISKFITKGWRVDEETEVIGLDQNIHGEKSYDLD